MYNNVNRVTKLITCRYIDKTRDEEGWYY